VLPAPYLAVAVEAELSAAVTEAAKETVSLGS
jgi:hypothetical protein